MSISRSLCQGKMPKVSARVVKLYMHSCWQVNLCPLYLKAPNFKVKVTFGGGIKSQFCVQHKFVEASLSYGNIFSFKQLCWNV